MIEQKVMFSQSPEKIYNLLVDEKLHSEFTGAKAKIENWVGGKFIVWDGYATGINIELVAGKKIVQTWKAADWPENSESMVTILLEPNIGGTKLILRQENVPIEFEKDIANGWEEFYWQPMKKYMEKNNI